MNYYERHLGDYARDTGHLSILEHGVYTLLLDRYYITEAGIPDAQVYRLSRARTEYEKLAVDAVLADFFELVDGVWVNHRAEEEILRANARINSAKENGRKGGRPSKQNPEETQTKPKQNPEETQTKPSYNPEESSPDTRHQSPDTSKNPSDNKTHTENLEGVGDLTPGGVCVFLSEQGILHTNPAHVDLIEALRGGAVLSDFSFAATESKNKAAKNPFPYALKIVLGRVEDRRNANKSQKPKSAQVDPGFAEKYAGILG